MAIEDHQLLKESLADAWAWAEPRIDKEWEQKGNQALLERGSFDGLSPRQHYEFSSFFWCNRLVKVFDKLRSIRAMTGRSLYKKKNESKGVVLQDWILHNYEHYTVVYQSILDVALLLTNGIFDLGNPYKKCSYRTVCDNTKINGTNVHHILEKLDKTVRGHREGKNLLVHRGEAIRPPLKSMTFDEIEVTNMAIKFGIGVGSLEDNLTWFVSTFTKSELIKTMEKECTEIESQVEELFSELLPYYRAFRSRFY